MHNNNKNLSQSNIISNCTLFEFTDKDEEGKDSTGEKDPKEKDPKSKEKESEDKKKKEKEDKKKKEKEEKKKKEAEKKKEKEKPKEPKIIHIKEPLQFESTVVDLVGLTKEQFNVSKEKLDKLNEVDQIKQDRETALNDLESFVLNVREKLYEELFEKSSTEEEREKIREKVITIILISITLYLFFLSKIFMVKCSFYFQNFSAPNYLIG